MNTSGIKKTVGMAPTQILANVELKVTFGVVVSKQIEESAVVVENGRKIVKAGTPLAGSLDARTTPFTLGDTDTPAVGVLLHDVDITDNNANGTLLVFGWVNTNRLSTTVKSLITENVKTALNAKVTFLAC